ncbi:MAG TPA: class I tRNA ligase family protein, partial [Bacteroidales bacterium]|nr:class I tRNA ligase family protein [Bacteroidales bacterium]
LKGWKVDSDLEQTENNKLGIQWFNEKLNSTLSDIEDHFLRFRISDALMAIYKLIWDDFCSWYLEIVKPAYQQPIDPDTLESSITFFENLMKILHPFMPFITEEVWHLLRDREEGNDLIISNIQVAVKFDSSIIDAFESAESIIVGIRNVRKDKNIPQKESIEMLVKNGSLSQSIYFPVVAKIGNVQKIEIVEEKPEGSIIFTVGAQEFYIPIDSNIDVEEEIAKLENELNYTNGFLKSVMKKLSNDRFVNNAPSAVVENERKKQADAEARKKVIEEQLNSLKK